jgi:hypothetical protein
MQLLGAPSGPAKFQKRVLICSCPLVIMITRNILAVAIYFLSQPFTKHAQ